MPRGGHATCGPAPDPFALRRDRPGDEAWTVLPSEGWQGRAPKWPLETKPSEFGLKYWRKLWRKPQAMMWQKLEMTEQLAAYVLAFAESVEPGAPSSLKTSVLRMEAELGVSLVGMRQLRWRVAVDEVAERRAEPAGPSAAAYRDRLKAVS